MSENLLSQSKSGTTMELKTGEFLQFSIGETETQLKGLGLDKDALLDPEDQLDRQVAVLRYNYLLAERSALTFNINDPNFWRMLRARLQPMILAYQTHEKFVQGLEGDALERKVKEMMEVYRSRLETTEQFKDLFFQVQDEALSVIQQVQPQTFDHESKKTLDGSNDIADIQANVINELKESLKDQERKEKKLEKQIEGQQSDLSRHEKKIEQLEAQNAELLAEIDRLSTENLQLKISIDASNKQETQQEQQGQAEDSVNDYVDADKKDLILKIESLERDLENTTSAAYNSFMANSDLGNVVLFILTAFKCKSINQLGLEVNRSLKIYGMTSVFRVKSEASVDFFGDGKVSDGDKMLFNNNQNGGRIADLGKNYLIFDERTALLVKGMPVDDDERCGRLKDNLNTLMQGAETSANLISLNQSAEVQKKRMEGLLVRSNDVFNKLSANIARNKKVCDIAIKNLSNDLRSQLQISPGGPQSARLNAALKKMDSGLGSLFEMDKMVDTTFVKNVSKVVSTLKT